MPFNKTMRLPILAGLLGLLAWVTVGPVGSLAAQSQAAPQGSALIIGQVVDADSGKGIPNAPVALLGAPPASGAPPQGRGGPSGRPFAVIADSQGRFFFGGLPAGSYVMLSEVRGYLSPGATGVASPMQPITLADGARVSDARIRLRRLSSILGRVVDDAGTPVVGVMVRAFRTVTTQGRPPFLLSSSQARTNDRGEFRLGSLGPDDYLVCACISDPIPFDGNLLTMLAARAVDLLAVAGRAITAGADTISIDAPLRTLPPTFHPNATMASRAERVRVAPGEDRANVDITITAALGRRVSGRLVGAPSSVTAQMLRLRADGDLPEAAGITQIPPMLVQPDGRFDFANVPPGQYVLEVTFRPGLRGSGPSGAALAFIGSRGAELDPEPSFAAVGGDVVRPPDPLWAKEPITVGDRDIRGLAVVLNRSLVVSGRVVFSGTAPQPNPQTLQRPILQMASIHQGPQLRNYTSGIQPDGTFEMRGVLPGRYSLGLPGQVPGWPTVRSMTSPTGELLDSLLSLEAADLTNLVITMSDAPLTTVDFRVQPMPKDETEAVWIRVFSADRRLWQEPFAAARRFRAVRASVMGLATISGLPPGEYLVTTAAENTTNWFTREVLERISGPAERFRLSESEKIVVEVRR